MNSELNVPEDIRKYDLHQFLSGPDQGGAEGRKLDIDDIFAKDFGRIVEEARHHHENGFFDRRRYSFHRPSDIDESMRFARFEGGTLLIWDDEDAIIGGFVETDLSIDADWQGQGLGTELVVEHFLDSGSLPTWHLDAPAYSRRGVAACSAAHAFPKTHADIYFIKAARHMMFANVGVFRPIVEAMGYADALHSLKSDMAASEPGRFEEAARNWMARRETGFHRNGV